LTTGKKGGGNPNQPTSWLAEEEGSSGPTVRAEGRGEKRRFAVERGKRGKEKRRRLSAVRAEGWASTSGKQKNAAEWLTEGKETPEDLARWAGQEKKENHSSASKKGKKRRQQDHEEKREKTWDISTMS